MASTREDTHFWQSPVLGGVELLRAQHLPQKFTPHVHDSFVLTVIEPGASPHHWVMQKRLAYVLTLLRAGASPALVAAELGFADQSHLTKQLKRAYGIGPGAFRSGFF